MKLDIPISNGGAGLEDSAGVALDGTFEFSP